MRPTSAFWTPASLAVTLAGLAVVLARPVLLLGAALLGGWLLAVEYAAFESFTDTDEGLEIRYDADRGVVSVDRPLRLALRVRREGSTSLPVAVRASLPVGVEADDDGSARRIELAPGERSGRTTFTVRSPVAGTFAFAPVEVRAVGPRGLFETAFARGPEPEVTVEAGSPRNVHVGRGGETAGSAFGEHRSQAVGSGVVPAGLREYHVGDAIDQIDWKATARLNEPYVREYEVGETHRTLLVVDHGAGTRLGPPGGTILDYLRTAAFGVHRAAVRDGDPLGLYAVGEDGLTSRRLPASTPQGYETVRRELERLVPSRETTVRTDGMTPEQATERAARLVGDDSTFAATLRPFLAETEQYVERFGADPLFETVRTASSEVTGTTWFLLFTTDENRSALRSTLRAATRFDNHAVAFLAPRILYETGDGTDVEASYEAYREFEEFRRELERLPRVSALEVAPGERLESVLAARRRVVR